jgi:hypothetical protein
MVMIGVGGGCRARQVRRDGNAVAVARKQPGLRVVAVGGERRVAGEAFQVVLRRAGIADRGGKTGIIGPRRKRPGGTAGDGGRTGSDQHVSAIEHGIVPLPFDAAIERPGAVACP